MSLLEVAFTTDERREWELRVEPNNQEDPLFAAFLRLWKENKMLRYLLLEERMTSGKLPL